VAILPRSFIGVLDKNLVEFGLLACLVIKRPFVIARAVPKLNQVKEIFIEKRPEIL